MSTVTGKRKRSDKLSAFDLKILEVGRKWVPHIEDLFPDIRISWVLQEAKTAGVRDEHIAVTLDLQHEIVVTIIERLMAMDGDYPREKEQSSSPKPAGSPQKRAKPDDNLSTQFHATQTDHEPLTPEDTKIASQILKNEFNNLPAAAIDASLRLHGHVTPAYHDLFTSSPNSSPKKKQLKRPRPQHPIPDSPASMHLRAVLTSAKQAVGRTVDCGCCMDTRPHWQAVVCSSTHEHSFCGDCIRNYVSSSLIGSGACRPVCFDISGECTASISADQLSRCIDPKLMEILESLQQQDDLRQAFPNTELEQCPECEFQVLMEVPPEVDRELRCLRPTCKMISCRLCRKKSHLPLTCEEQVRKERTSNTRKVVEEAMTEGLLRRCNKCKDPFVKEYGCNKIFCSKCNNIQCYVCSANVKDYSHFNDSERGGKSGQCPLWDGGIEAMHEREVKQAADAAVKTLLDADPNLKEDELRVKFSESVQFRAGPAGVGAAAYVAGAYPPGMPPPW